MLTVTQCSTVVYCLLAVHWGGSRSASATNRNDSIKNFTDIWSNLTCISWREGRYIIYTNTISVLLQPSLWSYLLCAEMTLRDYGSIRRDVQNSCGREQYLVDSKWYFTSKKCDKWKRLWRLNIRKCLEMASEGIEATSAEHFNLVNIFTYLGICVLVNFAGKTLVKRRLNQFLVAAESDKDPVTS